MKKILILCLSFVLALSMLVGCNGGKTSVSNGGEGDVNPLVSAVKNVKLIACEAPTAAQNPVDSFVPTDVAAPSQNVLSAEGTQGEEITIDRSGNSGYGGGQYISKLFTEALSRAATGEEYAAFQSYLIENGCTAQSLQDLAEAVFSSELFESFNLTNREIAFCVYRAILARDPSEDELASFSKKNLMNTIAAICGGEEFASILPDIVFGPYFWRGNNENAFTDGTVLTYNEFNALIGKAASTKVIELPQGALVILSKNFTLPDGYTLKTEGNPDHYIKFARIHSTGGSIVLKNNCTMLNIFSSSEVIQSIIGSGSNVVAWGNRFPNIHANPDTTKYYIANNLVTRYETDHMTAWADGIDVYSNDTIVEYNHVVDATDGGIVVFRNHIGNGGYQNSVVRYNLICNTGNSAYVGLDHEGVDGDGELENFIGTISYENEFYTSYVAHMHMCITLTSRPWTFNFNQNQGVSIYNNYCADGCFVNTAGGIVAEGIVDGTVRGNQFVFYVGDWTNGTAHAYSVNQNSSTGDFQLGFVDLEVASYIVRTPVETLESYTVKAYHIVEEFQNISASKFSWGK